jgi:hypothetical protein
MGFAERRKFLWIIFLACLGMLALLAALGNATTFVRLPFKSLAAQATAIARVRCVSSSVRWERGELWTDTKFEVLTAEKGSLPGVVTVRTIGGSDGHVRSRVDGVPEFRKKEELYLFLWAAEGEPYRLLGWSQGTFRILRDPITGGETVTQDSAAVPVFDPRTGEFQRAGIGDMPVARFRQELKKVLVTQR